MKFVLKISGDTTLSRSPRTSIEGESHQPDDRQINQNVVPSNCDKISSSSYGQHQYWDENLVTIVYLILLLLTLT